MLIIFEACRLTLQNSTTRHIQVLIPINQNVFNVRVIQQLLKWPHSYQFTRQTAGNLHRFQLVDRNRVGTNKTVQLYLHKVAYGGL